MTALRELLERYPAPFRSELEKALVVALDEARDVALEEAAIICDVRAESVGVAGAANLCDELAAEIRARKAQP